MWVERASMKAALRRKRWWRAGALPISRVAPLFVLVGVVLFRRGTQSRPREGRRFPPHRQALPKTMVRIQEGAPRRAVATRVRRKIHSRARISGAQLRMLGDAGQSGVLGRSRRAATRRHCRFDFKDQVHHWLNARRITREICFI